MPDERGRGAIFVLPTTTAGQQGPVASWTSAAGWAAGAERVLGDAWVVTKHGTLTVDEVRDRAAPAGPATLTAARARRAVPKSVKTLVKDIREARRARQLRVDPQGPWSGREVAFVWQRHELFHSAGLDLADRLAVPSVLFVPAPVVWQAKQWGVRRPGWARWLERHGERPALMRADLVACGTELVAQQVARFGVAEERLLVTPSGVDLALFDAPIDRTALRRSLGLGAEEVVVCWAGSFRAFHGLDQLVRAASTIADCTLLMVGDGPERAGLEALAGALGVRVCFTGVVPHATLPSILRAADVGAVLSRPGEPFHYSPLKLAEYLAAGLPVLAPAASQLTERLGADDGVRFFAPGDLAGLTAELQSLVADPHLRSTLSEGARNAAPAWSWDRQVERISAQIAVTTG